MRPAVLASVLIALFCALPTAALQKIYLSYISVGIADYVVDDELRLKETVTLTKIRLHQNEVTFKLDLGTVVEGQDVTLHPLQNTDKEFKIEQRFETSLTIQEEGPHLDLLHWKHHYSGWKSLEKIGKNRFRVAVINGAESRLFPKVTLAEVRSAVLKAGGKSYLNYIRRVKHVNDYPAAVGVSKISLRISVRENSQWKVIHLVHFLVPMGC